MGGGGEKLTQEPSGPSREKQPALRAVCKERRDPSLVEPKIVRELNEENP